LSIVILVRFSTIKFTTLKWVDTSRACQHCLDDMLSYKLLIIVHIDGPR